MSSQRKSINMPISPKVASLASETVRRRSDSMEMMANLHRVNSASSLEKQKQLDGIHDMSYELVSESAAYLMAHTQHRPTIGIICGSGLARLADLLSDVDIVPYSEIPHFVTSTVPGHESRMLFGLLQGVAVMLMQGRFHAYEGYSMSKVAMPVRVMKLCGVEKLIVTNAAGGLRESFRVGDVMILKDHINIPGLTGKHPLKGPNDTRFGGRFFALNGCYTRRWRQEALRIAKELEMDSTTHEGVYAMISGPNFETAAELRMLKICGVDAVGMSTLPEVLVAAHCGVEVFAFSLITNKCVFDEDCEQGASHDEVLQAALQKMDVLMTFVAKMVRRMDELDGESNGTA